MIRQFKKEVPVETPVVYKLTTFNNSCLTVRMTPGAGGTIKLQYQITANSDWVDGPLGERSVATNDVMESPVYALKFITTVSPRTG